MQDSKVSNISKRVKKLLALADGNQNEHERDAAMKLAMELLSKHNLDLASVNSLAQTHDVVEFAVVLKLEPWLRSVLHAVCKLYYTEFFMRSIYKGYYRDRKEWHPTFVGTEENINVTMEVAAWLINSIRLESNCLFSEQYERRSFRLGAAHRLYERACALIHEEKNLGQSSKGNELMVLRNQLESANHEHISHKKLGSFQPRGSYHDGDAYGMGESFGDSVNLGRSSKPKAITMRG
ncbi:hypothetical protein BH11CYA1_BH11CYA1_42810 [soil metagenome]